MAKTIDTLMKDGWEVYDKEYEGKNLWVLYKKETHETKLYDPITDDTMLPLLKADFRVDFIFRDKLIDKTREGVERLVMYKDMIDRQNSGGLPWAPEEIKDLTFNETMQAFYDRDNKVKGVFPRDIEGIDTDVTLSVTEVKYGWFLDNLPGSRDPQTANITLDQYIQFNMPEAL